MFTGIIQKVARIQRADAADGALRLKIATGWEDLEPGESIAVNGVCLTVTEYDRLGDALFFVSAETLSLTNLGSLHAGDGKREASTNHKEATDGGARVNLERAVTLGTRLSGHLVQGHVDGIARLASVKHEADAYLVRFEVPAKLGRYLVHKGSIALNGVSLTINALAKTTTGDLDLSITLIPHTWQHTQFQDMKVGDPVNVEVDVLAKYVESLSRPYADFGVATT